MFALEIEEAETAGDFDLHAELVDLRCHPSDVLQKIVRDARAEQTRWKLREVLATRVLDERDALKHEPPDHTQSTRNAHSAREVGRALESLPEVAKAAWDGRISWDQLEPLSELATPETDGEWASRGPRCSPSELHRLAHRSKEVSPEDSEARKKARTFSIWRRPERGMVALRGELPDIDGVLTEAVFERMIERMRPEPGQPWDTRAHRMADAFMELVRNFADADPATKGRARPLVTVQVPADDADAVEVNGMAVAKRRLADYLADAEPRVNRQVVDPLGGLLTESDLDQASIPGDIRRFVLARDRWCRTPGCERPAREIHHMDPRSFGGNHDPKKLAGVCTPCHHKYEPYGPWRLIGDPDVPGSLERVHVDDQPRDGPSP